MAIFKKKADAPAKPVVVSTATKKGRQALNDRLKTQRMLDKDGNIK